MYGDLGLFRLTIEQAQYHLASCKIHPQNFAVYLLKLVLDIFPRNYENEDEECVQK